MVAHNQMGQEWSEYFKQRTSYWQRHSMMLISHLYKGEHKCSQFGHAKAWWVMCYMRGVEPGNEAFWTLVGLKKECGLESLGNVKLLYSNRKE